MAKSYGIPKITLKSALASLDKSGKSRRKLPRISIDELNREGIAALRKRPGMLRRFKDRRSAFQKALDWIDLPRNVVAQAVAKVSGYKPKKEGKRATFGLKRIFMGDVLKHMGVENKVARGILGFVGDVAIDPLTYVPGGIGKHIGAHVPRVMKSGTKQIALAAKAARGVKGAKIPLALAKATGIRHTKLLPEVMKRLGAFVKRPALGKEALEDLGKRYPEALKMYKAAQAGRAPARKLHTVFEKRLAKRALEPRSGTKAAQETFKTTMAWFAKHGLKGMPIAKIPFTQAAITLTGKGKAGKLHKAMTSAQRAAWGLETGKVASAVRKGTADAVRSELLEPAAVKLAGQLQAPIKAAPKVHLQAATAVQAARQALRDAGLTLKSKVKPGSVQAKLLDTYRKSEARRKALLGVRRKVAAAKPGIRKKAVEGIKVARKTAPAQKKAGEAAATEAAAKLLGLRTAVEAPLPVRLASEAKRGAFMRPGSIRAGLSKLFGPGRSVQRSAELGAKHQATLGKAMTTSRIAATLETPTNAAIAAIRKAGITIPNRSPQQILSYYLDLRKGGGAAALHASDVGVGAWAQLSKLNDLPEVRALTKQTDEVLGALAKTRKGRGAKDITGYYPRKAAPSAMTAIAARKGRGASKGYVTDTLKGVNQPSDLARARNVPITSPEGVELLPRLSSSLTAAERKTMLAQGYKLGKDLPVSMMEMDKRALSGRLGKVVDASQLKGEYIDPDVARAVGRAAGSEEVAQGFQRFFDLVKADSALIPADNAPAFMSELASGGLGSGLKIPQVPPGSQFHQMLQENGMSDLLQRVFPQQTADMVERWAQVYNSPAISHNLINLGDMSLGWFKRWALTHPGYTLRNIWSNALTTTMAGGLGAAQRQVKWAFNPKFRGGMWEIVQAVEKGQLDSLAGKTIQLGGNAVPMDEIARQAMKANIVGVGRSSAEFTMEILRQGAGAGEVSAKGFGKAIGRGVTKPVMKGSNWIRKFNSGIEDSMRMGAWLGFLEEGLTWDEALKKTLLAMPDMTDITAAERAGLARVLPWYRWMKANGTNQLLYHAKHRPEWFKLPQNLQNLVETAQGDTTPRELRPEWMREAQAAQFSGDREGGQAFLMRSWFPFEEVHGLAAGLQEPGAGAEYLASQLRPGLKFGIESATGHDVFRKKPVESLTTGQMLGNIPRGVLGKSGTTMDSLVGMRPVKEYNPWGGRVAQQKTTGGKIARGLIGGAVQQVSRQAGMRERDLATKNELVQLRRDIARAGEAKDMGLYHRLMARYMQIQRERQSLGLPVFKATEAALEQAGLTAQPAFAQ